MGSALWFADYPMLNANLLFPTAQWLIPCPNASKCRARLEQTENLRIGDGMKDNVQSHE